MSWLRIIRLPYCTPAYVMYGYHTLNFRMTVAEVTATKGEHGKKAVSQNLTKFKQRE